MIGRFVRHATVRIRVNQDAQVTARQLAAIADRPFRPLSVLPVVNLFAGKRMVRVYGRVSPDKRFWLRRRIAYGNPLQTRFAGAVIPTESGSEINGRFSMNRAMSGLVAVTLVVYVVLTALFLVTSLSDVFTGKAGLQTGLILAADLGFGLYMGALLVVLRYLAIRDERSIVTTLMENLGDEIVYVEAPSDLEGIAYRRTSAMSSNQP